MCTHSPHNLSSSQKMEGRWCLVVISITVAASATLGVKLLNWLWFTPRNLEKFLRNEGLNGNPYRPFLGDLTDLARITKQVQATPIQLSGDILRQIFPYYIHIISKYGPNSFSWFGPYPKLNIVDPEMIREVLRRLDAFEKGHNAVIKSIAGGVASLDGEEWAVRRKIINPAFHLHKLKNMVPAIGLSCSDMLRKWEAMVASGEEGRSEIDVWPFLQDLAGDVISRTAFGSNIEEGRRMFQLHREILKLSLQIMRSFSIPGWRYLPTKTNKRIKSITKEMQSIIRSVINKRQNAEKNGEEVCRDDLLGILMESNSRFIQEEGNNKNAGMSTEDVMEECRLFYSAGSETTSRLLVWTMVLLSEHPEWQTRAREEVLQVFGHSDPTAQGLNHLKTMTMIFQEALRLYPPLSATSRRTKEIVKLKNLTIPKGVQLTLLIGVLHYDPKIWGEDAKEFKPQRFLEGVPNAAKTLSSFIPFGSGPRVCIGQNFAMTEAKIALTMILQRFSFELSPAYSHCPVSFATTTPKFGAPLILRRLSMS